MIAMLPKGTAMPIVLNVNGEDRITLSDPLTPLIDVLRDELFLTGAKAVCREGICGACTVMMDDKPVMSCLVPVGIAAGHDIRTAEALSGEGEPSPLQRAMLDHDVVQCGMCFPGMMVTLTDFLEHTPKPTREEVKAALVGNICRCTGYERLIDAVLAFAHRD
jgi:carbon-monoxide dehydrogenase small subunit